MYIHKYTQKHKDTHTNICILDTHNWYEIKWSVTIIFLINLNELGNVPCNGNLFIESQCPFTTTLSLWTCSSG